MGGIRSPVVRNASTIRSSARLAARDAGHRFPAGSTLGRIRRHEMLYTRNDFSPRAMPVAPDLTTSITLSRFTASRNALNL